MLIYLQLVLYAKYEKKINKCKQTLNNEINKHKKPRKITPAAIPQRYAFIVQKRTGIAVYKIGLKTTTRLYMIVLHNIYCLLS